MSYKITSVDPAIKAVYVEFSHNGHELNHTTFVEDAENADDVTACVERDYAAYKTEVESAPVEDEKPELNKDVEKLIGKEVEPEE